MTMLESDLKEAIRLGNVQRAQIEHLQSLQARQTTPISPGEPVERSVPPLSAGGETTAEGQLAILQDHFNALLLQVLPHRCLNNRDCIVEHEPARAIEVIFFSSDLHFTMSRWREQNRRDWRWNSSRLGRSTYSLRIFNNSRSVRVSSRAMHCCRCCHVAT
jgi:hypothetical protein